MAGMYEIKQPIANSAMHHWTLVMILLRFTGSCRQRRNFRYHVHHVGSLFVLGTCLAIISCAPTLYEEYLSQSLHRSSQEDIVKQLGPPRTIASTGQTSVWTYQASGERVYGTECTIYMLLFDRDKQLQDWLRLGC